jgi:hypothetical protein
VRRLPGGARGEEGKADGWDRLVSCLGKVKGRGAGGDGGLGRQLVGRVARALARGREGESAGLGQCCVGCAGPCSRGERGGSGVGWPVGCVGRLRLWAKGV